MTQAPHPIDIQVGDRIRIRRKLLGLTQQGLARQLGLTAQQVQKYESGASRVAASRLHELAQILDVPICFFFKDLPKSPKPPPRPDACRHASGNFASRNFAPYRSAGVEPGFGDHKRETLELVRAYHRITAPAERKMLLGLAKELADSSTESPSGVPQPS